MVLSLVMTSILILLSVLPPEPLVLGNISDANTTIFTAAPPEPISAHAKILPVRLGEEYVVSSTFRNNDPVHDGVATFIVEVRDPNGLTILLNFQSGILNAGGKANVGVSWTPLQAGTYQLRTFAISSFEDPRILSSISSSEVAISDLD